MKRFDWAMGGHVRLFAVAVLLVFGLSACQVATIRPIGAPSAASAQQGSQSFDARAYVESIWASKVLPAAEKDAVDLPTLLSALDADAKAAQEKYGHHESGRPYNFLVKGQAQVLQVDTSSRAGRMLIDLPPFDKQADATIQIGPVLRGTAVRDAVGFIQFNQFVNQIEYADVANALNDRVTSAVLKSLDTAALQGKTVSFVGAFTLEDRAKILITPVKLEVESSNGG